MEDIVSSARDHVIKAFGSSVAGFVSPAVMNDFVERYSTAASQRKEAELAKTQAKYLDWVGKAKENESMIELRRLEGEAFLDNLHESFVAAANAGDADTIRYFDMMPNPQSDMNVAQYYYDAAKLAKNGDAEAKDIVERMDQDAAKRGGKYQWPSNFKPLDKIGLEVASKDADFYAAQSYFRRQRGNYFEVDANGVPSDAFGFGDIFGGNVPRLNAWSSKMGINPNVYSNLGEYATGLKFVDTTLQMSAKSGDNKSSFTRELSPEEIVKQSGLADHNRPGDAFVVDAVTRFIGNNPWAKNWYAKGTKEQKMAVMAAAITDKYLGDSAFIIQNMSLYPISDSNSALDGKTPIQAIMELTRRSEEDASLLREEYGDYLRTRPEYDAKLNQAREAGDWGYVLASNITRLRLTENDELADSIMDDLRDLEKHMTTRYDTPSKGLSSISSNKDVYRAFMEEIGKVKKFAGLTNEKWQASPPNESFFERNPFTPRVRDLTPEEVARNKERGAITFGV
jgi:hypothetical protein